MIPFDTDLVSFVALNDRAHVVAGGSSINYSLWFASLDFGLRPAAPSRFRILYLDFRLDNRAEFEVVGGTSECGIWDLAYGVVVCLSAEMVCIPEFDAVHLILLFSNHEIVPLCTFRLRPSKDLLATL